MGKNLDYIYSTKKYLFASTWIFILSFIAGMAISAKNPEAAENLLGFLKDAFSGITLLDPLGRMIEIFKNNIRNSFLALIMGLGFGIVPFLFAVINGIVLGILVEFFFKKQGLFFIFAAILPHGIVELPMVLMSVGIGFRLGHTVYMYIKHQRTTQEIIQEIKLGIIFYFKIITPLLFLAAIIESFITPFFIIGFIK